MFNAVVTYRAWPALRNTGLALVRRRINADKSVLVRTMLGNQRERPDSFILVVGDDANARAALIEILEMYGYPAVGVRNGKEGLSYLRSSCPAALIVLDFGRPVMNGSDLGCEQENNSELAAVPAVYLRAQGIEVFDAILTPDNLKYLLEVVSKCIDVEAQD
ncbi:MAG: response regulator [Candidatus Binataceae bacterium]